MPVVAGNARVGELPRIFLDPASRSVSHLVVMPDDVSVTARLVPAELLADWAIRQESLDLTGIDFDELGAAVEYTTLPGSPMAEAIGEWMRVPNQAAVVQTGPVTFGEDVVPSGKVGITFGEPVSSLGHQIGRVAGLTVEVPRLRATELVVDEGHLWSKARAHIPLDAAVSFGDHIEVTPSSKPHGSSDEPH